MHNKALSLLLIFSLAFNIAFVGIWLHNVVTGEDGADAERPAGGDFWRNVRLTDEQKGALQEDFNRLKQEISEQRQELEEQRDRLLALMAEEEPDENAIREYRERIDRIQGRIRELVVQHMHQTRDLLSPEQRRKWLEGMRQMGRHRGAQDRRRGFRGPPDSRRHPDPHREEPPHERWRDRHPDGHWNRNEWEDRE